MPPRRRASATRARSRARASPPSSRTCSADPELDAVVLATPSPATPRSPSACCAPASTASSRSRWRSRSPMPSAPSPPPRRAGASLMVGHLLEYHPGVAKLKEIADSGELGDIHYIYSNRLNLGKLRADENALWSLGAHDVSVVLHLADEEPYEVDARGESYTQPGIEDVVFGYLRFPSGLRRAPAPVLARPAQGAALHGRRLEADGDLRRHGHRAQGDHLRQGLRRGHRLLRRVHHPRRGTSGARGSPTASRCGSSASTSSTASATGGSRSPTAPAGCAWCACSRGSRRGSTRPGGSRVQPSDRAPGLILGEGVELAEDVQLGAYVVIHPGTVVGDGLRDPGPGRARQAAEAGARTPARRARRRRRWCSRPARSCARARSCSPARRWARARSSATRRSCASAR